MNTSRIRFCLVGTWMASNSLELWNRMRCKSIHTYPLLVLFSCLLKDFVITSAPHSTSRLTPSIFHFVFHFIWSAVLFDVRHTLFSAINECIRPFAFNRLNILTGDKTTQIKTPNSNENESVFYGGFLVWPHIQRNFSLVFDRSTNDLKKKENTEIE